MTETRSFQAQTKKLLDLMIHSIYAHKDVFLRELVSNASDAIDKVRFDALTNPGLGGDQDWKIKLVPDKALRTLTIRDNGCGMSYEEVVENIGTIAKSGSESFSERLRSSGATAGAPDLIGQFGVGFYSAFMVARKVVLETQKYGEDHAVRWESTGDGTYTIARTAPRDRGTEVTLWLRDKEAPAPAEDGAEADTDADVRWNDEDYTDVWTLRRVVKKYSDFIAFPIAMDKETWEYDRDDDGKIKEGGEHQRKFEEEVLNSQKALWTRAPASIDKAEHEAFYRQITRDWTPPGETVHFHAEGTHSFTALLYVPEKAPFDLFSREPRRGLQLYIKRVFIAEDVRELLPEHLRFVKGLVDSADLPLNVSRETVQHDKLIGLIRKQVARKLTAHLKDVLEKDRPRYERLWAEFGSCIKEGFHYDPTGKDKLADLILVRTTGNDGWSTWKEVASRCREGQTTIPYLTGESREVLQQAPQLEAFRGKGVEVVLLHEPVDEIMVGGLDKVEGKELKSAARGDVEGLPDAAATQAAVDDAAKKFEVLLQKLQEVLADDVKAVRISQRLTDSAVCLVADVDGPSAHYERMMHAMGQGMPASKKILELNGEHAAIAAMAELAEKDKDGVRFREFAEMLLDQALLAEGAPLKNPARFAQRVAQAMARAI
ncbi:MAG: molecular chaperone HtpG [Myxococcales bacterium]|nr:molecular chaperone HtpG [Myxococcales bacterium]